MCDYSSDVSDLERRLERSDLVYSKRDVISVVSDESSTVCFDDSGSSSDSDDVVDSDVNGFLTIFNNKFGVNASCLHDVLDLMSNIVHSRSRRKSGSGKSDDAAKRLEMDNGKLQRELQNARTRVEELESELAQSSKEIWRVTGDVRVFQKKQSALKQAMQTMSGLVENQAREIEETATHKSLLLEVVRKQGLVIEELVKERPLEETRNVKSDITRKCDDEDVVPLVVELAKGNVSEPVMDELRKVQNSADCSWKCQIVMIAKVLLTRFREIRDSRKVTEEDVAEKWRKRCREILGFVEEELMFINKLSESRGLQQVVCGVNAGNELIRRSARVGRFLDETLGAISNDAVEERVYETGMRSTGIFELMKPSSFEEKVAGLLPKMRDPENIDLKEAFELLLAQVIMNDILMDHAICLKERLQQLSHEMDMSCKERCEDHDKRTGDMQRVIHYFKHRENKLRRYLSQYADIPRSLSPIDMVKIFVDVIDVGSCDTSVRSVGTSGYSGDCSQDTDYPRAVDYSQGTYNSTVEETTHVTHRSHRHQVDDAEFMDRNHGQPQLQPQPKRSDSNKHSDKEMEKMLQMNAKLQAYIQTRSNSVSVGSDDSMTMLRDEVAVEHGKSRRRCRPIVPIGQ